MLVLIYPCTIIVGIPSKLSLRINSARRNACKFIITTIIVYSPLIYTVPGLYYYAVLNYVLQPGIFTSLFREAR